MLLPVKQINSCRERYGNISQAAEDLERSTQPTMAESESSSTQTVSEESPKGIIYGDTRNRFKREQNLKSTGIEPVDFALERAIGENDAVYSNFVELILDAKKKIGRINIMDGIQLEGYATGFMVTENLLLTNWHVFETKEMVGNSFIEFDYELDIKGHEKQTKKFRFLPDEFYLSVEELDYCLIAVDATDSTGNHALSEFGYLPLKRIPGKLGDIDKERLNIIHHPNGEHKQLSIRENVFTKVMSQSIWYESDTAQGSSGSPVFNDQWQVVALHHMGVAKRDMVGNYLDKNDNIIEIIDGKIDSGKVVWIANEGIRISVILKDLESKNESNYINKLLVAANSTSDEQVASNYVSNDVNSDNITENNKQKNSNPMNYSSDAIHISLPPATLDKTGNINVNITTDRVHHEGSHQLSVSDNPDIDLTAAERRSRESTMNYDDCEGYQVDFLGSDHEVLIPGPLETYPGDIVKNPDDDDVMVLDYYLFSVLHDAERRLPAISAINVDGNEDLRKDKTERKDKWLRDNRIDFDVQLNNAFYSKSGFDKGHMTRREDANWGQTAALAKRNADLTCVYTNACPQVPHLNRSTYSGLWGKLEKKVLEHGATDEDGNTGKVTVLSGPIFQDDDPVFKGVQIPMDYYKVILWLTDNNNLKATAFKLSQEDLVSAIDFEQIDIDQDIAFKAFQTSLSSLQDLTHLDFSELIPFDTFSGIDDVELLTVKQLRKHLAEAKKK